MWIVSARLDLLVAIRARVIAVAIILAVVPQPACSVYKAATQPGPADLSALTVGTQRVDVIGKLGAPKLSETGANGNKQDTFEFQSGFHQASKMRVVPYMAADAFTIGLAEILLWPMELTVLERANCVAVVTYDANEKVEESKVTKKDGVQAC